MQAKHTPGPWHVGMRPGPIIYGSDNSQVADCRGDLLDSGETRANTRLIAAAPDMLAMLIKLTRAVERLPAASPLDGLAEDARAVIARATGEA